MSRWLQLVVGRQRAGAGDDIQSGVQGAAAQIPQQQTGGGAVLILHRVDPGTEGLDRLMEGDDPSGVTALRKRRRSFPGAPEWQPNSRAAMRAAVRATFSPSVNSCRMRGAVPQQGGRRPDELAAADVHGGAGIGGGHDGGVLPMKQVPRPYRRSG